MYTGVYALVENVLVVDLLVLPENVPLVVDDQVDHEVVAGLEVELEFVDLQIEGIVLHHMNIQGRYEV